MSSASIPFADVTGKGFQECNLFCDCSVGEKRFHIMDGAEVLPVSPISQPDFLSLSQDPVGGVSPRSNVKTRELMLSCRRSISQEAPC